MLYILLDEVDNFESGVETNYIGITDIEEIANLWRASPNGVVIEDEINNISCDMRTKIGKQMQAILDKYKEKI